jgi:hypothetical protein
MSKWCLPPNKTELIRLWIALLSFPLLSSFSKMVLAYSQKEKDTRSNNFLCYHYSQPNSTIHVTPQHNMNIHKFYYYWKRCHSNSRNKFKYFIIMGTEKASATKVA